MLNKTYLPACLLLALLATACGKKSDDSQAPGQPINQPVYAQTPGSPTTSANPTTWPQIQGWDAYYYVNYQFSETGCTTGLRRFSGPSSEDVRRQLCGALQNEWMNGRCAQSTRYSAFANICSGYSWNPR
jgi:hypothetical protein